MTQSNTNSFEPVARGLYLEGLAVDLKRGVVWYSDVIAGGIHGVYPDGSKRSFNQDRKWTGGVMMNEDGCVLSTGGGGIMWTDPETGKSGWLLSEIDGERINGINEMAPDGEGGIYFGMIDVDMVLAGQPPRPGSIYHLTADLRATKVADGLSFANAMMVDATRRRLYSNDSFASSYAYDIGADFTLSNKRLWLDKVDADGMALDSELNVWITGFKSSAISRVRPDGTMLPSIQTPGGAVTQVRFGGADLRDIYINTVPADAGEKLAIGELPTEETSVLYRGRSEIPGLPVQPARFKIA